MFDDDWKPARETQGRNGWSSLDELRARLEANRMTSTWTNEVLEDVLREETILNEDGSVSIKWSPSFYNFEELRTDVFSLIDEADSMTMPVLVMVAASNNLLESHLKPFAERLPQGEFAAIEGVGHGIYMEDPDLVAQRASVFFKDRALAD
jgi:pimeloyl-ACP methyl ester carboxylesterase